MREIRVEKWRKSREIGIGEARQGNENVNVCLVAGYRPEGEREMYIVWWWSVCLLEKKNQIFMWAMGNRGVTWQSQNAISFANRSKSVVLHAIFIVTVMHIIEEESSANWMARKIVHMCNFAHLLTHSPARSASKCTFSILKYKKWSNKNGPSWRFDWVENVWMLRITSVKLHWLNFRFILCQLYRLEEREREEREKKKEITS